MPDKEPSAQKETLTRKLLAGCIIQNSRGEILFIHRITQGKVQWELPGGKLEPGEDSVTAARREAEEELGVEVEIISEAGRHEFTENGTTNDYTWYNSRIISGEPRPMEDIHNMIGYFSWDELNSIRGELSSNASNLLDARSAGQLNLN
ncbi:MAG: NUDIX hydrolase [Patescibacteria group bacterium]|nr:NUDIX hydrolase [Patescibacteria group bacterium]